MKIIATLNAGENSLIRRLSLAVLFALIFGLLFYANYQYTQQQPGGTDFLYRWLPTRLVVVEGYENPYSPEVEYQVELMHHGHAHQGDEPPGIFAYPYYIIPIYIPFSLIKDFALARAIWMTMLELIHFALVILTLRLINFRPGRLTLILLLMVSLFTSFFTQPIIDGNPSPIAALFVLLCLIAISKDRDWLAGILLAFSTIKPQLVILFFILVWVWAFSNKRWKIILGSGISLVVMLGVSFLILPVWFTEFLKDVFLYPEVASPHSPFSILQAWFPSAAKWVAGGISLIVALVLGREWLWSYKKGFGSLFWAACLTFSLLPISGISSAHSNFIAILPGFILVIAAMQDRWRTRQYIVNLLLVLVPIISWTFFSAGLNGRVGNVPVFYLGFFPVPIAMAAALYWARKYLRKTLTRKALLSLE